MEVTAFRLLFFESRIFKASFQILHNAVPEKFFLSNPLFYAYSRSILKNILTKHLRMKIKNILTAVVFTLYASISCSKAMMVYKSISKQKLEISF
jgi:hypothetical protein